jgi:hypothetical protein
MIAAAVLLAAAQAKPQFTVEVDQLAPVIVVQAHIKAPFEFGYREAAAWNLIGEMLLDGTEDLSKDDLLRYGSQAGIAPSVLVLPDLISVQVVLPPDGLGLTGTLLEAMLMRPKLTAERLTAKKETLKARPTEAFTRALNSTAYDFDAVRLEHVLDLHSIAFRAENIVISAGGPLTHSQVEESYAGRFRADGRAPARRAIRYDPLPKHATKHFWPVWTHELQGEAFAAAAADSAGKILAMFALGSGKDASVYRVLREDLRMSYQQAAILWPNAKGWVPRVVLTSKSVGIEGVETARTALLKDVEAWNEESLVRAKSMAAAAFTSGSVVSPLWIDPYGPMTASLVDRTRFRGLMTVMGTPDLRLETLRASVDQVELAALKAAAKQLLETAQGASIQAG